MSSVEGLVVSSGVEGKRKLEEASSMSTITRKQAKHAYIVPEELTTDASSIHEATLIREAKRLKSSNSTKGVNGELLGIDESLICNNECYATSDVTKNKESPLNDRPTSSNKRHVRFTDSPVSVTVYIDTLVEEKSSDSGDCATGLNEKKGEIGNACTKMAAELCNKDEKGVHLDLRKRQNEAIRSLLRKFS